MYSTMTLSCLLIHEYDDRDVAKGHPHPRARHALFRCHTVAPVPRCTQGCARAACRRRPAERRRTRAPLIGYVASGGRPASEAKRRAWSARSTGRWVTTVLTGQAPRWFRPSQFTVGRIRQGENPPPQFRQMFLSSARPLSKLAPVIRTLLHVMAVISGFPVPGVSRADGLT
jgi:hypothetical protein